MTKVYKVVRVYRRANGEERLMSAAAPKSASDKPLRKFVLWGLILDYAVNKVTRPKIRGTKLFAFATLERAQYYTNNLRYPARIFLAEATGVEPGNVGAWPGFLLVRRCAAHIVALFQERRSQYIKSSVVLCQSIKLLEEVSSEP